MSIVFINNLIAHYESLGKGRPVLFLHSWFGSWRYWVPAMQLVATSHSAYALDLLGFGDTSRESAGYSLEGQVSLLEGFLDEMGIDRIAIVGHGLGAIVGVIFAGRRPSRVARLLAAALPLDPVNLEGHLHTTAPDQLTPIPAAPAPMTTETPARRSPMDPRVLEMKIDANLIRSALAEIREAGIPALLVYGDADPLMMPPALEDTLALGPNFHQVVLEAAGHLLMIDAPDLFSRLLLDFLTMEPGTSPRNLRPREEWRRRLR